jgi:predicted O-methyltransferase YrrM
MKYNLDIPGWMTENDLRILNQLASCVPENGNILEVGSFLGRSTHALFAGKPPSVRLEVVDTFKIADGYMLDFDETYLKGSKQLLNEAKDIASTSGSWLEAFKHCITPEVAEQLKINCVSSHEYEAVDNFDMVFLDGSHSLDDVVSDMRKFASPTTLLVGDDFELYQSDVALAICKFRNNLLNGFTRRLIVPENSKIWILIPSDGYWKQFQTNTLI